MRRFDWHAVVFWSCLGVAIVYVGLSTLREDGKIPTVFDKEGQRIMRNSLSLYHPELAKWLGVYKR